MDVIKTRPASVSSTPRSSQSDIAAVNERNLLLVLASVQFTYALDFLVMMPMFELIQASEREDAQLHAA